MAQIIYDPQKNPFGAKSINFALDEIAFVPGLNTVDNAVFDHPDFQTLIDFKAFVIPEPGQPIPEPVKGKKKADGLIEIPVPTA